MTWSCTCGREWTGLAQAHCPTCHEHFSTVANFDRHRAGTLGCQNPATMSALKPSVNRFGTTWVGAGEYVGPSNDAAAAIGGAR